VRILNEIIVLDRSIIRDRSIRPIPRKGISGIESDVEMENLSDKGREKLTSTKKRDAARIKSDKIRVVRPLNPSKIEAVKRRDSERRCARAGAPLHLSAFLTRRRPYSGAAGAGRIIARLAISGGEGYLPGGVPIKFPTSRSATRRAPQASRERERRGSLRDIRLGTKPKVLLPDACGQQRSRRLVMQPARHGETATRGRDIFSRERIVITTALCGLTGSHWSACSARISAGGNERARRRCRLTGHVARH